MTFDSKIKWWNQMMDAFKHIHNCGIVHRDLKPEHFMTKNNKWYILDFGLSNTFLDSNNKHIQDSQKNDMIGTPKYASINIHYGHEYTCRDDFISLIYIFIDIMHNSFINFYSLDKNINTKDISLDGNFNLWLKEQKEWHNINSLAFENKSINSIFYSLFFEAENLTFYQKPYYTLLLS
jgi:serine/threonine protein kinase